MEYNLFHAAEQMATFNRRHQQLNRQLPVRSSEMGVLIFIQQQVGPVTATHVGQFLGIAKPSVTPIIKSLIHQGFLLAEPLEHDQRQKSLTLTHQGHELLTTTQAVYLQRLERIKGELGAEKFEDFITLMNSVNTILETELIG